MLTNWYVANKSYVEAVSLAALQARGSSSSRLTEMSVICIGPCCIPVAALFPFLAFLIAPILNLLRKTPLGEIQLVDGST